MKRLNKTKLILLLTIITFLSGINKVGAFTCEYLLPYSGYDAYNNKVVNYGTETGVGSNGRRAIEVLDNSEGNNRHNNFLSINGYFYLKIKKNTGTNDVELYSWIKNDNIYGVTRKIGDFDVCPKYISVTYNGNSSFSMYESNESEYKNFLGGNVYSALLNVDSSSFLDSTLYSLESDAKIIIPLFRDGNTSVKSNYYTEIAKKYNDIYANAWDSELDKLSSDMASACGTKWKEYVNISNYNDISTKPNEFLKYMLNGNSKGKFSAQKDANLSSDCISTRRRRFAGTYITFYDYWYTILQLDTEQVQESVYTLANQLGNDDNYYNFETGEVGNCRNFYVIDLITRKPVFFNKAVEFFDTPLLGGSKRITDSQNTTSVKIAKKYTDIEDNNNKINVLSSDLCSGYCSSNTVGSTGYERCKYESMDYITCSNDLKECKNQCVCNQQNSSAQTACLSNCNPKIKSCLESANPNHSKALSDRETKINELYKSNEILQSEINEITTALTTFDYNPLSELPGVNWNFAKYTPKCSDVKIFTEIWQAMRIIAPFLMIIFGSLDFFKAVIANDMEAMKKAKSKFPKRLIAFLLLIIIPSIVSIIMKAGTNGAENTTYFRCIVTGDKGDDN